MGSSQFLQDEKARLRKELQKKLEALRPEARGRQSQEILRRLFHHPRFEAAHLVFTYVALPLEVETQPILEEARRRGKKVFLPRMDSKRSLIQAIEVKGRETLEPNEYGVLEPPFDAARLEESRNLDLIVVPGLGFDRRGGRLGRGKGYFDRFLGEAKKAYKIGLAFECQLVERVPRGINDVLLDEVLVG